MKKPRIRLKYDPKKNEIEVNADFLFFMMQSFGLQPEITLKIIKELYENICPNSKRKTRATCYS